RQRARPDRLAQCARRHPRRPRLDDDQWIVGLAAVAVAAQPRLAARAARRLLDPVEVHRAIRDDPDRRCLRRSVVVAKLAPRRPNTLLTNAGAPRHKGSPGRATYNLERPWNR